METQSRTHAEPNRDQTARRAYELWEKAGRPPGRDLDYWLQAEAELRSGKQPRAQQQQSQPKIVTPTPAAASGPSAASAKAPPQRGAEPRKGNGGLPETSSRQRSARVASA